MTTIQYNPGLKLVPMMFVTCLLTGCWTTVRHLDTGDSLGDVVALQQEQSANLDARIVVRSVVKAERQDFDHRTIGNIHHWKEADGIKDITRYVAVGLQDMGYRNVSYQPNDTGDFIIEGYIERPSLVAKPGYAAVSLVTGFINIASCFIIPAYVTVYSESHIVIRVQHNGQNLTLRTPIEIEVGSTMFIANFDAIDPKELSNAVANVASSMIKKVNRTGTFSKSSEQKPQQILWAEQRK